MTLGQEGVAGKGDELKAMRALLDALVLDGCIVTIDALGCETDIAAAFVAKGGDYVLTVKDNQKTLSETLAESFGTGEKLGWGSVAVQSQMTVEKDHGRLEIRRILLVSKIDWLPDAIRAAWPKLGAVGMVETTQERGVTLSRDRRYFIMSHGLSTVGNFARAAGRHFPGRRLSRAQGPRRTQSLADTQNHARHASPRYRLSQKNSLRQRRNRASRKPLYREELLGLRPRNHPNPRTETMMAM